VDRPAVLIVASVAIAVGVAAIPALLASRTHPGAALRDQ
jgi:ABC-type lipoprotein release transport system permease subunit